jgi:hypothetical protein
MQQQVEGAAAEARRSEPNYTLDQVRVMNDVKRRVEALEEQMDYSLRMLQQQGQRDRGGKGRYRGGATDILPPPGHALPLPDLEAAMKTVPQTTT